MGSNKVAIDYDYLEHHSVEYIECFDDDKLIDLDADDPAVRDESNEELVQKIKNGDTDKYIDLWNGIKAFVSLKARAKAYISKADDYIDDMLQESFIILHDAVDKYDPDRGMNFLSYFSHYYLTKAFNRALYNCESQRYYKDPVLNAISLDAPISDDDNVTLVELLVDTNSYYYYETVDDAAFWKRIGQLLKWYINQLKGNQRILMQYLMNNNTTIHMAYLNNVLPKKSLKQYYSIFAKAKKHLREKLCTEIEIQEVINAKYMERIFDGYKGSFRRFKNNGNTSIVEEMVFKKMEKEKDMLYLKKYKNMV